MKKLIVLLVLIGGYKLWSEIEADSPPAQFSAHDEVIMYSLTTCGYCKQKGRELQAADIAFTEYFIDVDAKRRSELTAKLQQAGFAARTWGTPILDVHGVMLPNNPSVANIREHMK